MRARVVTLRVREGKLDEVVRVIREGVVPDVATQPGFLYFVLTSDRETGKAVGTSYWDTEAQMLAGESSGYFQKQVGRVIALLAAPRSSSTMRPR